MPIEGWRTWRNWMQPVLRNMREDMVLYRARPQGQSLCSHMEAEVDGGEGLRGQSSGQGMRTTLLASRFILVSL